MWCGVSEANCSLRAFFLLSWWGISLLPSCHSWLCLVLEEAGTFQKRAAPSIKGNLALVLMNYWEETYSFRTATPSLRQPDSSGERVRSLWEQPSSEPACLWNKGLRSSFLKTQEHWLSARGYSIIFLASRVYIANNGCSVPPGLNSVCGGIIREGVIVQSFPLAMSIASNKHTIAWVFHVTIIPLWGPQPCHGPVVLFPIRWEQAHGSV